MKLVVFDIDGVILHNNVPVDNVARSIRKLSDRGIKYTFCTGRGYLRSLEVTKEIYPELPFIVEDGGKIIYTNGKQIVVHPIKREKILNLRPILHTYAEELIFANFCPINGYKYRFLAFDEKIINDIKCLPTYYAEALTNNPDKFISWAVEFGCAKITLKIKDNSNISINSNMEYSFSEKQFCCFNAEGINKGSGLLDLVSILNIPLNNIIVIGNDFNDIPMFKLDVLQKIAIMDECYPNDLTKYATQSIKLEELPNFLDLL